MTDSPDKAEVRRGLARIRALRRLFLGILFGYFPILVLCMAHIRRSGHWHALAVPLLLFVAGMVVQKILHGRRCPRCGELFLHDLSVFLLRQFERVFGGHSGRAPYFQRLFLGGFDFG